MRLEHLGEAARQANKYGLITAAEYVADLGETSEIKEDENGDNYLYVEDYNDIPNVYAEIDSGTYGTMYGWRIYSHNAQRV